jgi:hypothetical protein
VIVTEIEPADAVGLADEELIAKLVQGGGVVLYVTVRTSAPWLFAASRAVTVSTFVPL